MTKTSYLTGIFILMLFASFTVSADSSATALQTTFTELNSYHPGCMANVPVSDSCNAAINRFCQSKGYVSGFGATEHIGNSVNVACVTSAVAEGVKTTFTELNRYHSGCNSNLAVSDVCNAAINRFCAAKGYASGFGSVEHNGDMAQVVCIKSGAAEAVVQTTFTELNAYHASCNSNLAVSDVCNAAINRLCQSKGYLSGFGAVEHYGNNAGIACVGSVSQVPTCAGTRTTIGRPVTFSGVKFTAVSNIVDAGVKNTLTMTVENVDSNAKTVTYGKGYCRCKEYKGNPFSGDGLGVCQYYWSPGDTTSSCQSMEETIILSAHETKTIDVSVSQYQNQDCGSYQLDFWIVKVNGVAISGDLGQRLVGWSFTDLCQDCSCTTTTTPPATTTTTPTTTTTTKTTCPKTTTSTTTTSSTTTTTRPVSECPNPVIPIKRLQGISSISFVEQTGSFSINTYPIGGTALNYGTVDLSTTAQENYDFYISDADGTPDAQGSYISSVCNRNLYLGGIRSGHNLDSISLNLGCGSKIYADHVASYELGNSPYDSGYIPNILGPTDGKITYLGDGRSRITVGFCNVLTTTTCPTTTTSSTTTTTTSSTTTTCPATSTTSSTTTTVPTTSTSSTTTIPTTTTCHATTTTTPPTTSTTTPPATTTTSTPTTTSTIPCFNGVKISAKGVPAAGIYPIMQLWIDGKLKAQWSATDIIKDYIYNTELGSSGHNIDVVYTNDCSTGSVDRNLFVYQIQAGCSIIQPTDPGVTYDKGVGSKAFDGLDVAPGQTEMYTSGALRFRINGGTTTTTTTSSTTTTTNMGSCSLKGDYPKCGEITVTELLGIINDWSKDRATIQDIMRLLQAWSSSR